MFESNQCQKIQMFLTCEFLIDNSGCHLGFLFFIYKQIVLWTISDVSMDSAFQQLYDVMDILSVLMEVMKLTAVSLKDTFSFILNILYIAE